MKKLSILVASVAAALAFTSCETSHDDNPVLPTHEGIIEANFLNNPVLQNEYIELTAENEGETLLLTCSQPTEYGYAASVRYYPEISLTPDFADFRSYPGDWSSQCNNIAVTNKNVAEAICEMLGCQDVADLPQGYFPVYIRLVANVYTDLGAKVPNTTIVSNAVAFNHVGISYLAVWVPDVIQNLYVIGSMSNEWSFVDDYKFYTAEEKNTWVTKTITIPAGSTFKVSPNPWNSPFNGVASFNAGSNGGGNITVGEPYALYIDNNSNDITCPADFTGVAFLQMVNSDYVLTLIPD